MPGERAAVEPVVRRRLRISGVVQGVGFRPFLWRRATRLALAGWVENDAAGVVAEVQGASAAVAAFLDGLAAAAPPLARVEAIDVEERAAEVAFPAAKFAIRTSARDAEPCTDVPPDVATCAACLAEVADPLDRRHGYPFTNCTDCGPRFTILTALPYDRAATTMAGFAMCRRCAAEYADPAGRRFHAQPIACPDCGPVARFSATAIGPAVRPAIGPAVRPAIGPAVRPAIGPAVRPAIGPAAIAAARAVLAGGGIVAVKGLGGYHLACPATDRAALRRLRAAKHRDAKPLAVMVTDVDAACGLTHVDADERRLLEDRARPIVLLRRRTDVTGLPPEVAPAGDLLGVMLAYTPLHHLLGRGLPPLVMTSGNLADEPIVSDDDDALRRLGPLADGILAHDRPIHAPCDDSVVRRVAGATLPIRRARGYAPAPIPLAGPGPTVLAVGADLKAAVCLLHGTRAILGPHVGDLAGPAGIDALDRAAEHLVRLFGAEPAAVAADLHPGQLSVAWAARFAAARGIPLVRVQHHEAHAAALLVEHGGSAAGPPAGCVVACFDGTGYGRDGTIQGGEFIACGPGGMRRVAHLDPFPLPGGDAAIRHPWRTALALLHAAGIAWDERLPCVARTAAADRRLLARQLERGVSCATTSSMGRLFDGVAALVGVARSVSYEAEAAAGLEALARGAATTDDDGYAFALSDGDGQGPLRIGWQPVIAAAVADVRAGLPPARIAARFHTACARMIAATCARLRDAGAGAAAGLTGGVFQNGVLVELAGAALQADGFAVLTHRAVPPNDGGLALGQALLARAALVTPAA